MTKPDYSNSKNTLDIRCQEDISGSELAMELEETIYTKCPNCGGRIWMDDESSKRFFSTTEEITALQFLAEATFWCAGCGRIGTYEELKTGEPSIQSVAWEGELVPLAEETSMKELQALVAKAVADRGYREGWTDEQYAARQICKATEELAELTSTILWNSTGRDWSSLALDAGEWARDAFDEETWHDVKSISSEKAAQELPDVIIPLLVLADVLGIDLEQAIREKVLGDIERGVRGEKPAKQEQVSEYEQIIRNVERALEPVGWERAPSDVAEVDALAWEVTRLVKRWEELASEEACIRRYEVLRREKQEGQEWIPLSELRAGAIFETREGARAVKSEYHHSFVACKATGKPVCLCILLGSGEYGFFKDGNATMVREIAI